MCNSSSLAGSSSGWPRRDERRRAGFTLVELLVVIGIIALLISILLPSLNAARKQASRISCAANIRSIGQAYQIYAAEYKQEYPPVRYDHWSTGGWGSPRSGPPNGPDGPAILVANGYVKDPRIYYCPSEITADSNAHRSSLQLKMWARAPQHNPPNWSRPNFDGSIPGFGNEELHTGYQMYFGGAPRFGVDDPRYNLFARDAKDRGDKVAAADVLMRGDGYGEAWIGHRRDKRKRLGTPPDPGHPADPRPDKPIIFEGGNVLFNDGHVVWKDASEIKWRYDWGGENWDWFH